MDTVNIINHIDKIREGVREMQESLEKQGEEIRFLRNMDELHKKTMEEMDNELSSYRITIAQLEEDLETKRKEEEVYKAEIVTLTKLKNKHDLYLESKKKFFHWF
jgi:chromosome segregation ATPase